MIKMNKNISYLKREILKVAYETQEGHIPSAFSILDILYVLYNKVLKIDPQNPKKLDRDYFIMSKGHAAIGLYAILADKGFISKEELYTFGKYNSRLGGHPDKNKIPGVEASTGSLGHGLPMAVGIAIGIKIKNSKQKVFCLIGDGELNEGSMWESIIIASQLKLDNLTMIVDYNHSIDRSVVWGNLVEKLNNFEWYANECDGHNQEELFRLLINNRIEKPKVIIANTIKGFGCRSLENNPAWHHRAPNREELQELLEELE